MEKLFDLRAQGSDVKTEVVAGMTTFLATLYIVVVNPTIIAAAGCPLPPW